MNSNEDDLVSIGLGEFTDSESGQKSVRVEVNNAGKAPISSIELEWVYDYEAPQDATGEFTAQQGVEIARAPGRKPIKVDEVGRRYSFNSAKGEKEGPLSVGDTRTFLYAPEWMPDMLSIVQSLSPERYRVTITMNGREEVAISGQTFGEFIERRFGTN